MTERPDSLTLGNRLFSDLIQTPLFGLATIGFGSLSIASSIVDKRGRLQHKIARTWAKTTVRISRSPLTIVGAENLQKTPVAVYAANHTSYMDTPVLFAALPFQFRILGKATALEGSLHWLAPRPVWADSGRYIHPAIRNLEPWRRRTSPESRDALGGLPEGGRTETGHPQDFQSGAAYLAIRAQVPLVPMALVGVYGLLPIHTRQFHPRPLKLIVGEPILHGELHLSSDRPAEQSLAG